MRYDHQAVPNLPRQVVDMANREFDKSSDSAFFCSVMEAQQRVHLELLKMQHPGEKAVDRWWKAGFVPGECREFNEALDAERLLCERHQLKAARRFTEADAIRKRLESWGYTIGDDAHGTNWIVFP